MDASTAADSAEHIISSTGRTQSHTPGVRSTREDEELLPIEMAILEEYRPENAASMM